MAGGCDKQGDDADSRPVLIELGADGRIHADGRAVTLDALGEHVDKRKLRGPLEHTDDGFRNSGLDVVLRVDPAARWQHVQWLLTVCMEQKLYRTWFEGSGGRRVKVFQPTDAAIEWLPGYPRTNALCVTIDVEHGEDGAVRFRCGEQTASDVRSVSTWIAEGLRSELSADYVVRVGEIRASPGAAFRHVLAVMEAFAASAIERTWLYGTMIPTSAVRTMPALPAPDSRWKPPSGRGVRAIPYRSDLGVLECDWPEEIEEADPDAPPAGR
jgi:hypothetical protein